MIFDALVILAVIMGGGLLLFPVKVRFLFRVQKNAGKFEVRIFRKKVFTTEESVEEASEPAEEKIDAATAEEIRASEEDDFDDENPWKKEETAEAKAPAGEKSEKKTVEKSDAAADAKTAKASTEKSEKKPNKESEKEKSKKKSKKKSSDEEFLTLVLEPHFDKKLLKDSLRITKSFFRVFHCYFEPTVVDGIRLEDYEDMGYAMGGLNFLCGSIPLLNNWEFLMDWEGNRPLRAEGGFVASFSIARIVGFGLVSLWSVLGLVLRYLWNLRRYRKNPEQFRLIFWRRWIVRFFAAD